jgi:hypothetical protein
VFLLCLAAYIAVYALLSSDGNYEDNLSSLKKLGCLNNIATLSMVADREEWQPKSVIVTSFPDGFHDPFLIPIHANLPGYCFMPLVCVDRIFIHKTKIIAPTQ